MRVEVIIPALNEAAVIGSVVGQLVRPSVARIIVVDNGSSDGTAAAASSAGAHIVHEPRRGYGSACLAGLAALDPTTEVVVFVDGDGSDDLQNVDSLISPIIDDEADLVIGSRVLGQAERGALTAQQRVGNAIAAAWLRTRFGLPATDLGPFRAIRRAALDRLCMSDATYGWTVEMQIKAARHRLRYREIPVNYRRRVGKSKISGTLAGTLGAGRKIIGMLAYHDFITRQPTVRP